MFQFSANVHLEWEYMGNSFWFILYLSQVFFLECSVHPRWIKHDQAQGMRFIGLDSSPYGKEPFLRGLKPSGFSPVFRYGPIYGYVSRGTSVGETNWVSQWSMMVMDHYGRWFPPKRRFLSIMVPANHPQIDHKTAVFLWMIMDVHLPATWYRYWSIAIHRFEPYSIILHYWYIYIYTVKMKVRMPPRIPNIPPPQLECGPRTAKNPSVRMPPHPRFKFFLFLENPLHKSLT